MRVLILDGPIKQEIQTVMQYAKDHPVSRRQMLLLMKQGNRARPIGNNPRHVVHIADGYRCVFSIEEHPDGWCRHLSISVDKEGKLPSPESVAFLMNEFGFSQDMVVSIVTKIKNEKVRGMVWIEERYAINIVEVV